MTDGQLDLIQCAEQVARAATALINNGQTRLVWMAGAGPEGANGSGGMGGWHLGLVLYRHGKWSDCLAYFKYWFDLLSDPERGALRRYLVNLGLQASV